MDEFDYVVAGGGSAGCVVASRLSEDPSVTVCLLEAGGEGRNVLIRAPLGFVVGMPHGINSWDYHTVPQAGFGGRRGFQPRGKALGGSSTINAMIYARGHRSDYDNWEALGNTGWGYDDVLPFFRRSEANVIHRDSPYHGVDGPLQVTNLRSPSPLNEVFLQACRSQGIPLQRGLQRRAAPRLLQRAGHPTRRGASFGGCRVHPPEPGPPEPGCAHRSAHHPGPFRGPAGERGRVPPWS
ncbi:MAG: GMC family oxidoreductase N-terminal domain-containing protein [Microthrixaceae bacterium]|nr:GMC family oxidoreductase N-terminal domain-containing protein [Microthrixaceae bacterium]